MITNCSYSNPLVTLKDGDTSYTLVPPSNTNQSYAFGSSSCITTGEGSAASTTGPEIINGFTYGELINSFILFSIFMVVVFGIFIFKYTKK